MKALKISGDAAPGVDEIPYKMWRSFGDLAAKVLHDMAIGLPLDNSLTLRAMAHGCSEKDNYHKFNLGILCCLPKQTAGAPSTPGDHYTAAFTRPLSIVNTDNRIIANSMKLAWEPIFNKWVSGSQRGFLKGRSMLASILEIDEVV